MAASSCGASANAATSKRASIPGRVTTTEALATHVATSFAFDDAGRIVRNADPDRGAAPRLYIGGCDAGNLAYVRNDVGAATADAIRRLVAGEPPLDTPDRAPEHVDDYVALLAAEAPIERHGQGVNYCFPSNFEYRHDVHTVGSDARPAELARLGLTPDRELPAPLVAIGFSTVGRLWAPWCVALHDGEIASLAETVRIGPTGAEAGVNTIPDLRGRGFAAAATAGWAMAPSLRGRMRFYSTAVTNRSSQRVAERLGLHVIGASFTLT
jgi:hypothetical protein